MKPFLEISNLSVQFPIKKKIGFMADKSYLKAVDKVSFSIKKGKTLALVGESGSGKTTTALAIARLVSGQISGNVQLEGRDIISLQDHELKDVRQKIQVIFQDPYSSLNPRMRAENIVTEPLDNLTTKSKQEKRQIVSELFEAVGLRPEQKRLFPHQFSGGQRQRIGIARALSTFPELIICDEPVSALDVAVQAQILNLLRKLQKDYGLTYLFISHDLGVVQHMSDEVAVMYMGKIVEHADRKSLFANPQHPYTQALLSAVPSVYETAKKDDTILVSGEAPNLFDLPKGCRFESRCPISDERCKVTEPDLLPLTKTVNVACHMRHLKK